MTSTPEGTAPTADRAGGSLGAHSVVYLVGTALQGLGVLLVLPFATRVLGAVEFGRVATGLVVVQMVGTIAAAGLPQVVLREHHRGAEGPRVARALAGTMVLLALGLGVVGLALALLLSATGHADLRQWVPLVLAAVALTTVVAGQTLMRARLQPWGFLALAVLATVGAQLAGLLAARAEPTAGTYLTAYAGVVVLAAVVALVLGRPLPPTVERERVRAGIRLATPLLPQAAAMLGLLSGRRAAGPGPRRRGRRPAATRWRCSSGTCRSCSPSPSSTRGGRSCSRTPSTAAGRGRPARARP